MSAPAPAAAGAAGASASASVSMAQLTTAIADIESQLSRGATAASARDALAHLHETAMILAEAETDAALTAAERQQYASLHANVRALLDRYSNASSKSPRAGAGGSASATASPRAIQMTPMGVAGAGAGAVAQPPLDGLHIRVAPNIAAPPTGAHDWSTNSATGTNTASSAELAAKHAAEQAAAQAEKRKAQGLDDKSAAGTTATNGHSPSNGSGSGSSDGAEDEKGKGETKAEDKEKSEEDKEKEEKEKPKVPYSALYRYADGLDKAMIAAGTLGAMVMGASIPVFSIVFGKLLNSISPLATADEIADKVAEFSSWMVIIGALAFVGSFGEIGLYMMSSERQTRRLREEFLKAMIRKNVGWFDMQSSGALTSRLAADTKLVGDAIGEKVGTYIHFNTTFFVGLGIGFGYGWQLALVILAVTPLLGGAGFMMTNLLKSLATKSNKAYAGAGGLADEAISNVRTVQAFGAERREVARYSVKLDEAMLLGIRSGLINGLTLGITMAILFGSYGLALWYGTKLIHDGATATQTGEPYTGGDVMTVFFSVLMGSMGLGQAAPSVPVMAQGQAAAVELFKTIDEGSPIDVFSDAGAQLKLPSGQPGVQGLVELRGIHFRYPTNPSKPILQGLNLTIQPGEKVALVGASGCGKSTIVSLLERFYDPEQGTVLVDGVDLKTLNVRWWREHVGLVSQEPVLFAGSIRENILTGKPNASNDEIMNAARAANCHDFITALPDGYATLVGDKGKLLSGGQKQRIAIARAILKNPPVLLLDEATSALDTQNEKDVQRALDTLMANRTTIIVAHRLSTVRDAHRLFVLGGGVVLESGNHNQLMALNNHYARLVEAQEQKSKEELADEKGDDAGAARKAMLALQQQYLKRGGSRRTPKNAKEVMKGDDDKQKDEDDKNNGKDKPPVKNVTLGRVFSYSEEEKWYFAMGMFMAICNGSAFPLFSFIFSEMIAIFFEDKDVMMDHARNYALLFGALGLGLFLVSTGMYWSLGVVAEKLTFKLRQATFKNILRQNMGFFDDKKNLAGILITKLATDAATVHGLASSQLPKNVQMLTTLACGIGIAFGYGWRLALVVLAVMPIVMLAGALQWAFVAGFSREGKAAFEGANRLANESLGHIRTVASFTSERALLDRFHQMMDGVQYHGIKAGVVAGIGFAFSNFVLFATYAIGFWYGGKLIRDDLMTFSQVLKVFFALVMSAMGAGQAAQLAPDAAKAQVAANAIFELMDRVPPIDTDVIDPAKVRDATFEAGGIELKGVKFHYPTRPDVKVFAGLNLTIAPRTTVALVGASGSGKSTIIQMLQRFYDPVTEDGKSEGADAGTIMVDGVPLNTISISQLRKKIGIVSQEPTLFSGTIAENIKYGAPEASDEDMYEAARACNIHDFVMTLKDKYHTKLGGGGVQLSGGEKQRLAIARAVIRKPTILLLDEATSALDSKSEKVVQAALDNVMRGRTTIVIAHRLSTIKNANQIVVLERGVIKEMGTHFDLIKLNGLYAQLSALSSLERDE